MRVGGAGPKGVTSCLRGFLLFHGCDWGQVTAPHVVGNEPFAIIAAMKDLNEFTRVYYRVTVHQGIGANVVTHIAGDFCVDAGEVTANASVDQAAEYSADGIAAAGHLAVGRQEPCVPLVRVTVPPTKVKIEGVLSVLSCTDSPDDSPETLMSVVGHP